MKYNHNQNQTQMISTPQNPQSAMFPSWTPNRYLTRHPTSPCTPMNPNPKSTSTNLNNTQDLQMTSTTQLNRNQYNPERDAYGIPHLHLDVWPLQIFMSDEVTNFVMCCDIIFWIWLCLFLSLYHMQSWKIYTFTTTTAIFVDFSPGIYRHKS